MSVTVRTCHAAAASTVYGRMNNGIGRFHGDVDDIVPLAVRQISHDESDIDPHEDVTGVENYMAQDLRKMEQQNETTAQIIRWIEDDHKPSQAELALAILQSNTFGCFDVNWLYFRCGLISEGGTTNKLIWQSRWRGSWWLQNSCRKSYWNIVMTSLDLDI